MTEAQVTACTLLLDFCNYTFPFERLHAEIRDASLLYNSYVTVWVELVCAWELQIAAGFVAVYIVCVFCVCVLQSEIKFMYWQDVQKVFDFKTIHINKLACFFSVAYSIWSWKLISSNNLEVRLTYLFQIASQSSARHWGKCFLPSFIYMNTHELPRLASSMCLTPPTEWAYMVSRYRNRGYGSLWHLSSWSPHNRMNTFFSSHSNMTI